MDELARRNGSLQERRNVPPSILVFSNQNGFAMSNLRTDMTRDTGSRLRKPGLILEPTYGFVGPSPMRPSVRDVLIEWIDAISFWKDTSRLVPALFIAYHLTTFGVFVFFLARFFSIAAVLSVVGIAILIGTVYNTVWYHRYCSHRAFKFRNIVFARLFLWTNPICFREESYAIPHRLHHSKSDEPGDPYGPHLGWLGSYLAQESAQRMNRNISRQDYDRLAKSLGHIGFVQNSYEQYRSTGSVENVWHYAARSVFANFFWSALAHAAAGWEGVLAWISGVFLFTFVVRDFNFRGHASLFGTREKGLPVNQVIYGIIAGEWHGNHHAHPRLARSGFRWWQVDLPYWIIKVMHLCGVVTQCNSEITGKPVCCHHDLDHAPESDG
jgi:stearoyl-CoA desaturase (delta-9 desaturase)